jgi:hypothetical protein
MAVLHNVQFSISSTRKLKTILGKAFQEAPVMQPQLDSTSTSCQTPCSPANSM